MLLMIDNYDSFTFNLVQYFGELGQKVKVLRNDEVSLDQIEDLNPKFIVMAKKGNRIQVILECTEHKASGMPGTSRYITTKNKKNTPDRLELKKFNPILKKMTIHKQIK